MKRRLTAERLREVLHYAPETGLFHWRVRQGGCMPGREAGRRRTGGGYRVITVDGIFTYAHRLAWLYVHGLHPKGVIDHINGDPSDNRIANLRDCSQGQNRRNVHCYGSSGYKGVYRSKQKLNRWFARISVNKKPLYLGSFGSPQEAAAIYDLAARRYYGEFARTNEEIRRERGRPFGAARKGALRRGKPKERPLL